MSRRPSPESRAQLLTICSFTVLPSRSIVRIFWNRGQRPGMSTARCGTRGRRTKSTPMVEM